MNFGVEAVLALALCAGQSSPWCVIEKCYALYKYLCNQVQGRDLQILNVGQLGGELQMNEGVFVGSILSAASGGGGRGGELMHLEEM